MKKLIPFLAMAVLASGAYAQGVISFNNIVLTPTTEIPDRLVRDWAAGGVPLVGTQWAVQMYYSTANATSLSAHTANPQRFRATTTASPGTWITTGGTRTLNGGGVGQTVWVQARVWNLDLFPTYEAALVAGGITGVSSVFTYVQRLSRQPSPTDTHMDNFAGFLVPIPEPSVALLAIPAVAVLLCVRRKKATNATV